MRANLVLKLLTGALFAAMSYPRIHGQETNDVRRMEPVTVFGKLHSGTKGTGYVTREI